MVAVPVLAFAAMLALARKRAAERRAEQESESQTDSAGPA